MRRSLLLALALALAGAAVMTGVTAVDSQAPEPAQAAIGDAVAHVRAAAKPRRRFLRNLIVYVKRRMPLRAAPGGRIVAWADQRTEFGSPQTFPVVTTRGRWLAVITPAQPNGHVAWMLARGVRYVRTRVTLAADLSRRELVVVRDGRVVRRIAVAVGRSESTTPVGQFAVTDKLPGSQYGAFYGCCILALSGHQTKLPAGWTGGDRLAIHGGATGGALSAGCFHATDADLAYLMRVVPLGARISIRR